MPFDGLPEGLLTDLARLRIALDGVRSGQWQTGAIGMGAGDDHCAIGWLMVATDWNEDEALRLALEYVYPALPPKAQKKSRIASIWRFNDSGSRKRVVRLFEDAERLAEQRVVR